MKRNLSLAIAAVRELGVYPVALYASYELQRRVGWLRYRTPIQDWKAFSLNRQVLEGLPSTPEHYCEYRSGLDRHFFFNPEEDFSVRLNEVLASDEGDLLSEANGIVEGQFSLFGRPPQQLGFPPEWNRFPAHTDESDAALQGLDAHWTTIDIERLPADIKLLWEPSRFGWIYVLGRAFRLSGDRKYAEAFWKLLLSWRDVNPPNQGPHWVSAQEVALRLLALVFGHYAFYPYLKEELQHMAILSETIAAHADRIPPSLLYSRSQGNNHLIVEAVGLYTAGLLFPELKKSMQWHRIGRRWFVSALSNQVFSDGGYVQHSVNYHRLALQASLWAIRLGELNGESFPKGTQDVVRNLSSCLGTLLDPDTGKVPNFGPNDGALIFPLTTCSFHDYRPVIQLSNQLMFGKNVFEPGPWDEAAFWFGLGGETLVHSDQIGEESIREMGVAARAESDENLSSQARSFSDAGLHILGSKETWGLLRCGKFDNRPGHSDQLHLDLWWRGENIARDAGTYLYNGEKPWENGLATLKVHNSIVVDELEPMQRAGRFLWLNWAQGELLVRKKSKGGNLEFIAARHHGYDSLGIKTVRSVVRADDRLWLVVDELIGDGAHKLRSGWLLPDAPWRMDGNSLAIDGAVGEFKVELLTQEVAWGIVRAGKVIAGEDVTDCKEILGWYSPTYAYKQPGLYLAASVEGELPLRLVTRWRLGDVDPEKLIVEWDETGTRPMSPARITYGQEVLEL